MEEDPPPADSPTEDVGLASARGRDQHGMAELAQARQLAEEDRVVPDVRVVRDVEQDHLLARSGAGPEGGEQLEAPLRDEGVVPQRPTMRSPA